MKLICSCQSYFFPGSPAPLECCDGCVDLDLEKCFSGPPQVFSKAGEWKEKFFRDTNRGHTSFVCTYQKIYKPALSLSLAQTHNPMESFSSVGHSFNPCLFSFGLHEKSAGNLGIAQCRLSWKQNAVVFCLSRSWPAVDQTHL